MRWSSIAKAKIAYRIELGAILEHQVHVLDELQRVLVNVEADTACDVAEAHRLLDDGVVVGVLRGHLVEERLRLLVDDEACEEDLRAQLQHGG